MKKKKSGHSPKADEYAKAGVNLDLGDAFSKHAAQVARNTWGNSPYVEILDLTESHFRGPRGYLLKGLPPGTFGVTSSDGIGTKTIIVVASEIFARKPRPAAPNLIAMTSGDITRWGGLALLHQNVLEVKTLGEDLYSPEFNYYKRQMGAFAEYITPQGQILLGGETAEMSECVSTEITDTKIAYNWSDTVIGVNHPEKLIDGRRVRHNQSVIALRDKLRSNGASMMRKFFREAYGTRWWSNPEAWHLISEAAEPSELYDKFLSTMNGWFAEDFRPVVQVHAIAHLSGGGIEDKFAPLIFPRGFSAELDDLWEPPESVRQCVEFKGLSDRKSYRTFNGGQGVLAVIDEDDEDTFCTHAHSFGIQAKRVGHITKSRGQPYIKVLSKFSGKKFFIR